MIGLFIRLKQCTAVRWFILNFVIPPHSYLLVPNRTLIKGSPDLIKLARPLPSKPITNQQLGLKWFGDRFDP